MENKSKNTLIFGALLLAFVMSFLLWRGQYRYSLHKWHEDRNEKIIYDVMNNYVYPGVSVDDVRKYIGDGMREEKKSKVKEQLLNVYGLGDGEDDIIYIIDTNISRGDEKISRYFIVIHDGETVVRTALVDTLN